MDTNFEHFVAAAEAEAVGERFADREVDVPCPYASFRPLPGRCAYQYQRWKFFFQLYADGSDLAQQGTVVQRECWTLAAGVYVGHVWGLLVLNASHIDVFRPVR